MNTLRFLSIFSLGLALTVTACEGDDSDNEGTSDDETTSSTSGDGDGDTHCGEDPGYGSLAVGAPAKHIQGTDAFGEAFDMGDWCGKPGVIDILAEWCGPCHMVSECMAGNDSTCGNVFGGTLGADLRGLLENDQARWVTVVVQANDNSWTTDPALATNWDNLYPNEHISVVAVDDPSALFANMGPLGVFPTIQTTDEELKWLWLEDGQTWNNLVNIVDIYGN